jgi:hypothetical protein
MMSGSDIWYPDGYRISKLAGLSGRMPLPDIKKDGYPVHP